MSFPDGVALPPHDFLPPLMVAEDSEDDLFLLKRLFQKAAIKNPVLAFPDGAKAIDFLGELRDGKVPPESEPSLLFLDIKMPGAGGFEVLDFARRQQQLRALKIVMLSSSDAPADIQRAAELGADRYLRKHPTTTALGEIVRQAHASR